MASFAQRNDAVVGDSVGAMRSRSVAAVNTTTNQLDWLIPAPPAGNKIVLWKMSGPAVTGAASTAVLTFLTGGTTVATNTTTIGRLAAAVTVTAAFELPLVASAQPAGRVPLAIGEVGKSLHVHAVCTDATACIGEFVYSVVPDLSNPVAN